MSGDSDMSLFGSPIFTERELLSIHSNVVELARIFQLLLTVCMFVIVYLATNVVAPPSASRW